MGALTAALSRNKENIVPKVIQMLYKLEHRGRDAHGIATSHSLVTAGSIHELEILDIKSYATLGHNLSRILPDDPPQPVRSQQVTLVFEGRLFQPSEKHETEEILRMLRDYSGQGAKNIIRCLDGSYVFAFLDRNRMIAGRDTLGTIPLYYGEIDGIHALASERKALWAIGIKEVKPFPPGNLAIIDDKGILFQPIRAPVKPSIKCISMEEAARTLESLLLTSIRERIMGLKKAALAFSGGLDSSIIAFLTKKLGLDCQLLTVGLEDQSEIYHAESVAEMLGLPIKVKTFMEEDVERVLPLVLWLIEEPNIIDASIAIPIFWVAEAASKLEYNILLAGQGSDELFGGYSRYLKDYKQYGINTVADSLFRDISNSYKTNFPRDNNVCSSHGVELRLPFTDLDLISFVLSLPVSLNIKSADDHLRKHVLRKMAKNIGLPPLVYERPKKAIQYATGVDKIIRRLGRKEKLNLGKFIKDNFIKMYSLGEFR